MAKKILGVVVSLQMVAMSLPVSTRADSSAPTGAEEMFFGEMPTTSMGFFRMNANQAPGSYWSISAQELEKTPVQYVRDVFDFYAPGTAIQEQRFTGSAIGTRGIAADSNAKTLFMVDGQSLNQKTHFGYISGLELPFLGDVQKVEVINGPGSMLYGSGAINGFVNVTPKNGKDDPGFYVKYKSGSTEQLQSIEGGYGMDLGEKKDLYLYWGLANAEGAHPLSYFGTDLAAMPTNFRDNLAYRLTNSYRLASYLHLKQFGLNVIFQRIQRGFNSLRDFVPSTVFTADQRYNWQNLLAIRPKYVLDLPAAGSLEFALPVELIDHGVKYFESEGFKGGREFHASEKTTYRREFGLNKLALGAGAGEKSFAPRKQYFQSDVEKMNETVTGHWTEYEFFTEYVRQITEALTGSAGVRLDGVKYSTMQDPEIAGLTNSPKPLSAWSPRVALAYQINPTNTVKTSVQRGFRWPDATYFLYKGRLDYAFRNAGLPELKPLGPEYVTSYEVNYQTKPPLPGESVKVSFDLNTYYNVHENTLHWHTFTPEEIGTARYAVGGTALGWGGYVGSFYNGEGKYAAIGAELNTRLEMGEVSRLDLTYGISRPNGISARTNNSLGYANPAGNRWVLYPEHLVKASLTSAIGKQVSTNLTGYYASATNIQNGGVPQENVDFQNHPRVRLNMALGYQLNKDLNLSFSIINLTQNATPAVGKESSSGPQFGGLGDDLRRFYVNVTYAAL